MNIKDLTIENCHLYLEEYYGVPEQPKYDPNKCTDCDTTLEKTDHFYYCPECGTVDFDKPIHVTHEYVPPPCLYKRRIYCLDKLKMMSGFKQSRSKGYNSMIKKLEECKFNTIKELKKIMKELLYHKFYKFIYNIWFDIKGTRLIELTYNQIDKLSRDFVDLEYKFKQSDKHKRSNMLNYNSVIYYLLKKNKIKGYKHIILPFNHLVICKMLKQIV
jgi:predicted RNA-binding Zn-ribbon protein involved in translation (DUF1610 family)